MKQYKVIALSVGGKANKIFSAGDTVTEDQFIPGRADELVTQEFLQEISDDGKPMTKVDQEEVETEVSEPKDTDKPSKEKSLLDAVKNSLGDDDGKKVSIDSISKKEIVKILTDLGIPFEPHASKTELFELYQSRGNY
jgi:hypothetical protein